MDSSAIKSLEVVNRRAEWIRVLVEILVHLRIENAPNLYRFPYRAVFGLYRPFGLYRLLR